ncbi:MAG: RNA polymerase factor sigma-54 [Candidatus Hydrogenedentales bacterium]|jgi:RNA polymerase sigma-54 factor
MLHMDQRLSVRPELRQVLAPQMQQALQLLQMNNVELEQYIEASIEANPFLDRRGSRETPFSEMTDPQVSTADDSEEQIETDYEHQVFGREESSAEHHLSDPYIHGAGRHSNAELEEAWRYYQDSITLDRTLSAHLLDQLRLADLSPEAYAIGERLIINDINDRGYFTGDIAEITKELGVSTDRVQQVLTTIKQFEPTGVGASDLMECLLMQCEVEYPDDDALRILLKVHWEALTEGQFRQIADAMDITEDQVLQLRDKLGQLDPFPGYEYGRTPPPYIVPEVTVEKVDDDYIVVLTAESMPSVTINESYIQEIRSRKMIDEERNYVREHFDSARFLINNIKRRQDTILKTAQAIVDLQRAFMEKGVSAMRPLTLGEVAEKVGVHESTVSRTVNGKYMQTPQGLFELKYFFPSGVSSQDGDGQSSIAVSALIGDIIAKEDKRKPLSDQKIADLLNEKGIQIARRTVAKYREQSGLLPARMRRR